MQSWGRNSRLDNLQAAILNMRFIKYDKVITRRREIAKRYHEQLSSFEQLNLPPAPEETSDHFDVFQNYELQADKRGLLKDFLMQTEEVLKPEGRLVVMSYHSLEDRLVKNYIQKGKFSGLLEKDLYGNTTVPFSMVSRKAIIASEAELSINNRARSAKLRIAAKN